MERHVHYAANLPGDPPPSKAPKRAPAEHSAKQSMQEVGEVTALSSKLITRTGWNALDRANALMQLYYA